MESAPPVDVSVVLATRNRAAGIGPSLEALRRAVDHTALRTEVLVVDNGSTDDTAAVVDAWAQTMPVPTRRLYLAEPGLSRAHNHAVRHCGGRAVLFTDDDVEMPDTWVDDLAGPILAGEADIVGGPVVLADGLAPDWMSPFTRSRLAESTVIPPGNFVVGASMGFARTVFDTLAFDEELGPGALGACCDLFMSWQARELGLRLAWPTTTPARHHVDPSRFSTDALVALAMGQGRSEAYISRHWHHGQTRAAWLRRLKAELEWFVVRTRLRGTDVVTDEQLETAAAVAFQRQAARERHRPCLYERHGTRKRPPAAAATSS